MNRSLIGTSIALAVSLGVAFPRAIHSPRAVHSDADWGASAEAESGYSQPIGPPFAPPPLSIGIGPPTLPTAGWYSAAEPSVGSSAAVAPAAAVAPGAGSASQRIERELRHTDRLIAVLRPKVMRSGNSKAQESLSEAVSREKAAREAYGRGRHAKAERLTREARSLARKAAVMVGPPEEDPVYVARAIEQAEDALALAAEVLNGGADAGARRRFDRLQSDLTTARGVFKDGAMRQAHVRAVSVRDGVLDLLRDSEGLPVPTETASKSIRRAEKAVGRAEKEIGPKPNASAVRWRREAMGQLLKARSAFARREYRDAVIHSKLVERNLEQAIAAQRSLPKIDA